MLDFPRWVGYVLSWASRDRLLPTLCVVTETAEAVPQISAKARSDAVAALGAYAEPPTDAQLAAARRVRQHAAGAVRHLHHARLHPVDHGPGRRRVLPGQRLAERSQLLPRPHLHHR